MIQSHPNKNFVMLALGIIFTTGILFYPKKNFIMITLGIIFVTGALLFMTKGGEMNELSSGIENLSTVKVVKIADVSKINWEIEVIDESELEQI